MRVYNSFIAILGLVFALITVVLAALQVATLDIYVTAYTITLLVQSALYLYFSPRARRALGLVSLVGAAGFMTVMALKAFELLSKG